MPVVPINQILDPAFADRYGVAAINVVDDLTLDAVLRAATELEAPLIVQTSLKTVKEIGARQLHGIWRTRADEVPIPVSLHLDHCPDREWISTCLQAGWNSVLFDGSGLDVRENTRQTIEVVAEARHYGAAVEGEIETVHGVEDGIGSDEEGEVHPVEVAARFIAETGVDAFAPAIGTAHGLYARAGAEARTSQRARRAASDPDGAARRDRTDRGAVHRPDLARVREGQHLDGAEDRVCRRAPRVPRGESGQARPAVDARPRARGGQGDPAYLHVRIRRPGATDRQRGSLTGAGADLRLRRGARRHRARRPPGGVQRDVRGDGTAGLLVCRGVRREAADRRRQGADDVVADARVRGGEPAAVRSRRAASADRRTAPPQDGQVHGDGRRGPAGRATRSRSDRRRSERRRTWLLAVASTSAEESVRAVLQHAVGSTMATASGSSRVTSFRRRSPARRSTSWRSRAWGACRRRDRDRGLAQRAAGRRRSRAAVRRHGLRVHARGGHVRGGPRRLESGGSRRAGDGSRRSRRHSAGELVMLADLDACRTQPLRNKEAA